MNVTIDHENIEVLHQDSLILVSAPISTVMPALFPGEAEYISKAVEKRQREFATGRALARHGMELLGFAPQAIPVGVMRQPVWPVGLAGSITHTNTHCAVALGKSVHVLSIGIDMETAGAVTRELWDQ
ncbi:MAG: hypothetical protein IH612_11245, partial [Desulfofustis sp.]|nr:hypothetical protein [Desulfofustis sp.]